MLQLLRLTAYYAQQRVLCVTRTRVLKAVDCDCEVNKDGPSVDQDDKEVYAKEQQCGPTPTAEQVTLARRAP